MNFSTAQEPPYKQTSRGHGSNVISKCKQKYFIRKNQLEESCTEEEDYYPAELPIEDSKKKGRKGNSGVETRRKAKGFDSPQVFTPTNDEPESISRQTYCAEVRNCQTPSNRKREIESEFNPPMSYFPHPLILRELMNPTKPTTELPSTSELNKLNPTILNQTFNHPTKMKGRNDDSDLFCQHHRHRDHGQESFTDKQKNQMRRRYEQLGEMQRNAMRHSKTTLETENLSKNSTDTTTGTGTTTTGTAGTTTTMATTTTETSNSFRKSPRSSRRFETGQGQNFSNSTVSNNFEAERNQKKAPRPAETQKEIVVHDSFLLSSSFQKPQIPSTPGKVKEKLVYVVEEEGQDVKKLETELFTVNEILTIKKDLLELSEFARKLKKLKELKKEPEKGVITNDPCQCRPVSEVLNEVSKRMEALEARQEQLEKVSEKGKSKKKRDSEKGRKRSGDLKTKGTSNDQIDDGSHPNYDMNLPRMESLPHGSEIVTELMDLKSQLQKLEKKRMARVPSDSPHMSDSTPKKKKGHAIAVFSSKTYILAPPGSPSEAHETGGAYDEKKEKKKKGGHSTAALTHDPEDMMNKCIILDTKNPRRIKIETEKTKDDVVNWLNNIPTIEKNQPGNQMDDLAPQRFSAAKDMPEDMVQQDAGGRFTCNKCAQILTDEELKNQEPQKNPTTEENLVEKEVNRSPPKNVSSSAQLISKPYGCKKCYISALGDLYTVGNIEAGDCSKNFEKESNRKCHSGQVVSQSSCSTPTAILTKEYIEMVNKKDKITSKLREADFLEFASNPEKVVKTYRNTKTKSLYQTSSPCPGDKKIKETKNEMVKKQSEGDNMKMETKRDLSVSSTTTQSEFMASVDLDEEHSNEKRKRQKSPYNTPQIFVMKSRNCRFPAYTLVNRKCCKTKKDKRRRMEFCRKPCKRERRRCLKKCVRPTPIYRAQCPKKKRKCCYQHEKPRKQYCRERRKVEKCRERNGQSGRRPGKYAEDHHFKPPTACRSRQFKKRLQPCRDNEDPCQKPETSVNYCTERDRNRKSDENVCQIRKFFRDMKGFLPSFSDWNFFVDRDKKKDSYCPPNQQKAPLQVYYVQTAKVDSQKPRREGAPEHLRKCKCIRQFLRTQETRRTRDWPGSRPFPTTSEPSTTTGLSTSEYSTSSTVSHYYGYETVGRDFLVPVRRPEIYYIDHVPSEKQCADAIKCEKKKLKEKLKECKRRAKKEKCERKENKKKNKKCVCNICGNVHKKKKDKKGKTCEDKYGKKPDNAVPLECPPIFPGTSEESCCKPKPPEREEEYEEEDDCCEEEEEEEDECEDEVEDECEEEREGQGQPFFSFLKGICSSSKQKPKKSLGTKFRELRYLKTCSSNKSAPSGDSTYSEKPRKKIRYQRTPEPPRRSRHPDMCRCRKKPRKPSYVKPKKCSCPKGCSSGSGASGACHCQPILEQIENRLKYLENRLKNKKKKKKPRDMSGSSCDPDKCSPAYYCIYPQLNRGPEGDAGLQLATEDNRFFLDSKLPSSEGSRIWKKALKPKLSSLYSFFKYISRHGKEKDERPKMKKSKTDVLNSNDCLFDGLTTVPRLRNIHSLKPEPEHKIKTKEKIKNLMKSKRTIKEKEKTNRKR